MHMSTEPRLASLYVQHLPHVKKQALAQRSYTHVYRTQTSLSLHAKSSTHEETSPRPKIICTSTDPRLASLYMQHLAFSTCEETSSSLQSIVSIHPLPTMQTYESKYIRGYTRSSAAFPHACNKLTVDRDAHARSVTRDVHDL